MELPIVIHPEEAAEQVGDEDEAMGEHGTGDMEEFREDGLDGPRTADDQDCFSKFIVVRAIKKKSAEGMRAPHIFQTDNGGEFTINLVNTTLRNGGYRYFLFIVDLFSHYFEAILLKDQTTTSIVNAFMEGWAYRGHGVPNIMLTDQGKNVDGLVVHELCHDLGTTKRHTTQ